MSDITRELIGHIMNDDTVNAKKSFESALNDRVSYELDDIKQEVAASIYNESVEIDEEDDFDLSDEELEDALRLAAEELGYDEDDELSEEQIDELSKKTLGSYIGKAADRVSSSAYDAGEVNGLDMGGIDDDDNAGPKAYRDADKHTKGIKRAVKKLAQK